MTAQAFDWRMLILWTTATIAGVFISLLAALTWAVPAAEMGAPSLLVGGVGGAVLGAGTGVAQWLVMWRKARISGWWTLASAVGGMLGLAAGVVLADLAGAGAGASIGSWGRPDTVAGARLALGALTGALGGTVLGGALGLAQWLAPGSPARSSVGWLAASVLGWAVGLSLGAGLVEVVGLLASLLLLGAISGVVGGVVMSRLLERAAGANLQTPGP